MAKQNKYQKQKEKDLGLQAFAVYRQGNSYRKTAQILKDNEICDRSFGWVRDRVKELEANLPVDK